MVPLMVLVLALTPAARAVHVTRLVSYLLPLACLYVLYAICMGLLSGYLLRRWGRALARYRLPHKINSHSSNHTEQCPPA